MYMVSDHDLYSTVVDIVQTHLDGVGGQHRNDSTGMVLDGWHPQVTSAPDIQPGAGRYLDSSFETVLELTPTRKHIEDACTSTPTCR